MYLHFRGIALLFAFVALVICSPYANAGPGFQPVSPEELKMTSEPQAPGAPAVIIYREVDRDDDLHTPHEDAYLRIKILTDAGKKFGNVEIPFVKGTSEVVNFHARTIQPDGAIINADGKLLDKEVMNSHGFKEEVAAFAFPGVEVGSILEYYFTIDLKERYLFNSYWILSENLFTRRASFTLRPYVPEGWTLRWTWHLLPQGAAPKQGPDRVVRMSAENIPAFETEDHMPPANEVKSRVTFIYSRELLESNPDNFWRNYGKKRYKELEEFIGKKKAMEQAVAQIVSPSDTPEVKLQKMYARVQQIRNKSFEVRKTEQEAKRENERADENVEQLWNRGYGSASQLTWMFLALVRAAGFDASGCWVANRASDFFDRNTMEETKLRGAVVQVKLNGKVLYFSPGTEFAPFGLLTWSETAVPGLCLNSDGGTWIQTPLPESSQSQVLRRANLTLKENGDLDGTLTVTYVGLEAMYRRLGMRHADEVARKRYLEANVSSYIPGTAHAKLVNQPDWAGSDTPLIAEFEMSVTGWAIPVGKRIVVPVGLFAAGEHHTFEHENRVHPIYMEYPYQKEDDVSVVLPSGWKVESLPKDKHIDGHVVAYDLSVTGEKDVLRISRKLNFDFLLLDPKYYGALRNFYQAVRTGDDEQVPLQGTVQANAAN